MRPRTVLALLISLILSAPALAQSSRGAKANTAPKAGPGQPVFTPAADLKWTDLDPKGAPGVKVADLWGDHTKGHSARSSSFRRDSPFRFTRTPTP